VYVDIDVSIKVASDYSANDTIAEVRSTIATLFASGDIIPGAYFRISQLYNAIHSLAAVEYLVVNLLTASYREQTIVAVGDGVDQTYSEIMPVEPGLPLVNRTIFCWYGAEQGILQDDTEGTLRDVNGVARGTVDYVTGYINWTFADIPPVGANVVVQYRHVLDYQRTIQIETGDGVNRRFRGSVAFPPVVAFDSGTGLKGIAISDGNQTVNDDGDGNLTGDVDPTGRNTIDYATGAYDVTFTLPPGNGVALMAAYRQKLSTGAQDIPISKDQIAVEGLVDVATL
jgi:hypothetical protein